MRIRTVNAPPSDGLALIVCLASHNLDHAIIPPKLIYGSADTYSGTQCCVRIFLETYKTHTSAHLRKETYSRPK